MKISTFTLVLFLFFLVPCSAQDVNTYNGDIAVTWNQVFLELDKNAPGFRPCAAASSVAYINLAAYEAAITGMPTYQSLQSEFTNLSIPPPQSAAIYNWPLVLNSCYAYMHTKYFDYIKNSEQEIFIKIDSIFQTQRSLLAVGVPANVVSRSEAYGTLVAQTVYNWMKTDAAADNAWLNPSPSIYVPPSGPGQWQPTPPDYGLGLYPFYGEARTFGMTNSEKLALTPLPYSELSGSAFRTEAEEVVEVVANINANVPGFDEQKWIAEFWSDDVTYLTFSPPARVVSIANQLVENENLNLETCLELYAKIGLSMHDAATSIWYSKYYYNVERPIDYIQRVLAKDNPSLANWETLLYNPIAGFRGKSPNFPAYPSGHSGFGGVISTIFSHFFENTPNNPGTYTFTDNSHLGRTEFIGTPRTFSSFDEMGYEDAISRIPLGVHFRMDCDEGFRIGKFASQKIIDLKWKKDLNTCDAIQVISENNTLAINNASAPIVSVQIFDRNDNWKIVYNQSFTNPISPILINTLASGSYAYKIDQLTANWQPICNKQGVIDWNSGSTTLLPVLSVADIVVNEGNNNASLTISIQNPNAEEILVQVAVSNGTATVGQDFTQINGTILIPANAQTLKVSIPILEDNLVEGEEYFYATLSNALNATISATAARAKITIQDNDSNSVGPNCDDIEVSASNNLITVTGARAPVVSVQIFDTNDGWKTVFNQFYNNPTTDVVINNLNAGNYAYKVDLLTARWEPICKKEGYSNLNANTGTTPIISISNVTVVENQGTGIVTLTLSSPATQAVQLSLNSSNGTALLASDYTAVVNRTVTFPIGAMTITTSFVILNDLIHEPSETFTLVMSNPVNATLATKKAAIITIQDDDIDPTSNPCSAVNITAISGGIQVTGLSSPIYMVQVFDSHWERVYNFSNVSDGTNKTISNLPTDKYYVKVSLLTNKWESICDLDKYIDVSTIGITCNNVTNTGTISGEQTICSGSEAATITSVSAATGGTGVLEYIWIQATDGCPKVGITTNRVPNATGATLNPGILSQTTWFVRCAKRAGCSQFMESNCIKITVDDDCGSTDPCKDITFTPTTGSIQISGLSGDINMIQVFDAQWVKVYECFGNACASPTTTVNNLAPGQYFVKADILTATWQSVCFKEGFVRLTSSLLASDSLAFNTSKVGESVKIQWLNTNTDTEYFILERSADGQNFEELGTIEADNTTHYQTMDDSPLIGVNYYRLKIFKFDGSQSLSNVQRVNFETVETALIYPNPARNLAFIQLNKALSQNNSIQIVNQLGKVVMTVSPVSQTTIQTLDISKLENGFYSVLIIHQNGARTSKKLIVQNAQ